MYDTRNTDDKQNVTMFNLLCTVILPCLIKYNDTSSSTVQVPFSIALSIGKYGVNDGGVAGPGIMCRFSTITTNITKTVTTATKRNMNLSVMVEKEQGTRSQESRLIFPISSRGC